MEILDGPTIFWLFTLGIILGAAAKLAMGDKGLNIFTNIAFGVAGTLIVGGIGIELRIPGSLLFALMGSISILFLANVFFLQEDHEESSQH